MPEPHKDITSIGPVNYYHRLTQRSDEWLELRRGMITASEMDKILTPATLKTANNKNTRTHLFDLAAQRITEFVEPHFFGYDMERGILEEVDARIEYEKHFEPVAECGFVINDSLGFDLGFSPDGLVGDDGFIEIKSRLAKYQVQTIIEHLAVKEPATPIPSEFMLQCQTGLFVTGREWCDFISYSNGLNMVAIRVFPDAKYFDAIELAAQQAETTIRAIVHNFKAEAGRPANRINAVARTDYSEEIAI